ncbi:MAG: hypothetical protein WAU01_01115 [Saprospiraceae bacterium]
MFQCFGCKKFFACCKDVRVVGIRLQHKGITDSYDSPDIVIFDDDSDEDTGKALTSKK